jgi:hypothetical protein
MELLQQGREEAVAELAVAEPRAVRPLVGRLWDTEAAIRRCAAGAIGRAAEAHPELGLDLVRRLMWGLNDESATNGVYGIPALGEIGRRCPEMMEPFVPPLVEMARDEGLRLELLRALRRIAEAAPGQVARQLDRLAGLVDESREEEWSEFRELVEVARGSFGEGA